MNNSKKISEKWNDPRVSNVLGFLQSKGFLLNNFSTEMKVKRISVVDALWVGRNVEPRVLEVITAAIIHYPNLISDYRNLPTEIKLILQALWAGENQGPNLDWVSFEVIKKWVDLKLPDKRIKPLERKLKAVTFRLPLQVINKIKLNSKKREISEAKFLEMLVLES